MAANLKAHLATEPLPAAEFPDIPEWLHELYPFRTRELSLHGGRMSVLDEGPASAPPVVLLHGNATWSFLFRKVVPQLTSRFHVIAPDNIGYGLSSKPTEPAYHTLDRHIANFTSAMKALRLAKITLVLHGWGGPIGLAYAAEHPDNIARIVLANTWGFRVPQSRTLKLPFSLRLAHTRLGEWLEPLLHLTVSSRLSFGTARRLPDMALEGYQYPFTHGERTVIRAFMRMFLDPQPGDAERLDAIGAGLQNIKAPVTILWGERDPFLTKLPAYLLRDALKNAAEPTFLPQASHFVPEDTPEALAAAVLNEKKTGRNREPLLKILKS